MAEGVRRAVPGLPPLESIKDPAIREYLRALNTGWELRNGGAGNGFLTRDEVKKQQRQSLNGMATEAYVSELLDDRIDSVVGFMSSVGASPAFSASSGVSTGAGIVLPAGKWVVFVTALVSCVLNTGEWVWGRVYFDSMDVLGGNMLGLSKAFPAPYNVATGVFLIDNQTSGSKMYVLRLGATDAATTGTWDKLLASAWGENRIIGVKTA